MTTSTISAIIPCEIQKVWETLSAVESYAVWRSDVEQIERNGEKQFTEHTKDGYVTAFMVTAAEPGKRLELDLENSHVKGRWMFTLASKADGTELRLTADAEAKQLTTRPVGKSVFERTYLKKEQEQFVRDLKELLS